MANIKINDLNVYYELHGKGYPLVLIGGYACDHTFWTSILHQLTDQFQILIFDNRAVGQTKDEGLPFLLETIAEDVISLIQKLGLIRPHILGHSMGGAISQWIAKKYSNQINKLIMLNSAPHFNIRSTKALSSILNLRKANVAMDLLIEASMPWLFSNAYLANPTNISTFKTSIMCNPYPQSIQDQERQLNAILEFDSRDWINNIKTDTLIITAQTDILTSEEDAIQLKEKIFHSKMKQVLGGHSSPIEQPNMVCEHIFNFLLQ